MAIPVKSDTSVVGSLPSTRTTKFGIGDPRWVLRSLADLYSNRELAVAREYSTNGFDANKERALLEGTAITPLHVTLPSMMDPFFTVRDYGYGMSEDVLHEVYTQFGESTKRASNEFNGMLGFGCKSALAYTTTFTVTSIHAGIKTTVVVARTPDWDIEMNTVSMQTTDEPSGTEVKIPVSNWQEFTQKANDFYKFWLPGTVLVNGREPVHFVGKKITEGLYYSQQYNTSYVVMGNVPYRIANPDALFTSAKIGKINFVAYVDNGDVEFTPSREDLKYTDHTKKSLHKVIKDFEQKIIDKAQSEVDNAKDHADAYKKWAEWVNIVGRSVLDDLSFKGDKFVDDFKITGQRYDARAYRGGTMRIDKWFVEHMDKTLVVTDFPLVLTSKHKQMGREYARLHGIQNLYYVIFSHNSADAVKSPWITKENFVKWEDVKAALPKPPKKPRQVVARPGRLAGSFDVFTANGKLTEQEVSSDPKGVYWIDLQNSKSFDVSAIIRQIDRNIQVVILPMNRQDKFKRENPKINEFIKFARGKVETDGAKLLSDDAKRVMGIAHETRAWITRLDMSKIQDKNLARIAVIIKDESNLMKDYKANALLASYLRMGYNGVKEYRPKTEESIYTKYPLLREINTYRAPHPHVYTYMNAVNAAN
jgi:hypothetical protein